VRYLFFISRRHAEPQAEDLKVRGTRKRLSNCKIPNILCALVFFARCFGVVFFLLGCQQSRQQAPSEQAAEEQAEQVIIEDPSIAEGQAAEELAVSFSIQDQYEEEPVFAVIPPAARPGEPVTVAYSASIKGGAKTLYAVLLDSRGKRLTKSAFFDLDDEAGVKAAVLAIPSTARIGEAAIRIEYIADSSGPEGETIRNLPFSIEDREFQSETIPLNQANTDLRTVPDPQKTLESEMLWSIISRTGKEIYSDGLFTPPVTSTRRTSAYGSRRVYEYADGKTDTTIHAGVDCGVPTGTEVRSCAAGRVVLARERIVTGNTVILEHLPGVYSLYYHMDSIAVSEGLVVAEGTLLGLSGSTGLATGPHLHWEIRVSTENADPDAFMLRPLLDKQSIIDKLGEGSL
jgi:murein DD-endopeptidase MepM/ murein hydrolase activator NlpD